jgi:hypothetical protein
VKQDGRPLASSLDGPAARLLPWIINSKRLHQFLRFWKVVMLSCVETDLEITIKVNQYVVLDSPL